MVLLEDIGAETGLFVALFGLTMADITGDARWDAAGSIAIGVLLIVIAIILAVEMKGLLIGEAASDEQLDAIKTALVSHPKVHGIIHLKHHAPRTRRAAGGSQARRSTGSLTVARARGGHRRDRSRRCAPPSRWPRWSTSSPTSAPSA